MGGHVGAMYCPWRAPNQLWWHNYSQYRSDVVREIGAMRSAFGFTSVRVFLHDMLWDADAEGLITNMKDFLGILEEAQMTAGFVFFDDCWAHSGANLSVTCVPRKGLHNGCWVASPQDVDRTSTERFSPYVAGVVEAFATDKRVAWWEIFNEPQKGNPFSLALRDSAFKVAKAQNPIAPIISCWDDNNDTEVVDRHQYSAPWGSSGGVFANPAKGGIVTEAGCRWFQQSKDNGSPLTVLNWLEAIRAGGSGAPFSPGAMVAWEVMVGNSNTRWFWTSQEGDAEPAIPWCGSMYPDGSPVSYTEAAAFRRYLGQADDFLYLNTWLAPSAKAAESYFSLEDGATWDSDWSPDASTADPWRRKGQLYELTLWAASGDGAVTVTAGGFNISLAVSKEQRQCHTTKYLGCFKEGKRPGFILPTLVPLSGSMKWTMTNDRCAALCKDKNFEPFPNCGTERSGRYCMCGTVNATRWPRVDDSMCSTPCGGNQSERCGGEPAPGGTGDALSAYALACTGGAVQPTLQLSAAATGSAALATKDVSGRMIGQGWNMLRILIEPQSDGTGSRVRVWLNPTFADIMGPKDQAGEQRTAPPHAAAPIIDAAGQASAAPASLRLATRGGNWNVDYVSVLPPQLFGLQQAQDESFSV